MGTACARHPRSVESDKLGPRTLLAVLAYRRSCSIVAFERERQSSSSVTVTLRWFRSTSDTVALTPRDAERLHPPGQIGLVHALGVAGRRGCCRRQPP